MPKNATMEERFWQKVVVGESDECWMWTGAVKGQHQYGVLSMPMNNARQIYAHRYSAMLHYGMFHREAMVCHTCDVPLCVNPGHLYIGDVGSNARDMARRGRWRNQHGAGPNNPTVPAAEGRS